MEKAPQSSRTPAELPTRDLRPRSRLRRIRSPFLRPVSICLPGSHVLRSAPQLHPTRMQQVTLKEGITSLASLVYAPSARSEGCGLCLPPCRQRGVGQSWSSTGWWSPACIFSGRLATHRHPVSSFPSPCCRMVFFLEDVMACTKRLLEWIAGWLPRHFIGAILVSLPALAVYSHITSEFETNIHVSQGLVILCLCASGLPRHFLKK